MAAEMKQFASSNPADTHTLSKVPLRMGGQINLVDITISQRPDGSDWLLGSGTSGKASIFPTVGLHVYLCTTGLRSFPHCASFLLHMPPGGKLIGQAHPATYTWA